MKHIKANIISIKTGYIFHIYDYTHKQTTFGKSLFKVFQTSSPSLDTKLTPGTVFISGEENKPDIVNMFCSTSSYEPNYVQSCLDAMFDYFEFSTEKIDIHIPNKLGCTISNIAWQQYLKMLIEFEKKLLKNKINVSMIIYHK